MPPEPHSYWPVLALPPGPVPTCAVVRPYAVGVALLVAVAIVVYKVLGNSINDSQSGTASKVGNAVTDAGY